MYQKQFLRKQPSKVRKGMKHVQCSNGKEYIMPQYNLQVFFSFIRLFVSYSNKTRLIASHKGEKNSFYVSSILNQARM